MDFENIHCYSENGINRKFRMIERIFVNLLWLCLEFVCKVQCLPNSCLEVPHRTSRRGGLRYFQNGNDSASLFFFQTYFWLFCNSQWAKSVRKLQITFQHGLNREVFGTKWKKKVHQKHAAQKKGSMEKQLQPAQTHYRQKSSTSKRYANAGGLPDERQL